MFFRSRDIAIPPGQGMRNGAYAVSKRGEARYVGDFSYDPKLTEEYLQKMSDYYRDRGV